MKIRGKEISLLIFCSFSFLSGLFPVQPDSMYQNFFNFSALYTSGKFSEAERCMLSVLDSKTDLPDVYHIAALNNLGLVKKSTGLYQEAIDYYNRAEEIIGERKDMPTDLASIYNNKSRIYTFRKSYHTAVEYLEKSISIYLGIKNRDRKVMQNLSTAYLNLGIIYSETKNYLGALSIFEMSDSIKTLLHLPESELVFLNLAKVYYKTGNISESEKFFRKSLSTMERKFGSDYYRISEVYFAYGDFLFETGRKQEALEAHKNALRICLRNYGRKHPLVSLAYMQIGDYYFKQSDFRSSLDYYQNALTAIDSRFCDSNITANPSIDSSLFELRLLDILKSKSKAMKNYALECKNDSVKISYLKAGLATSDLSFRLIERIRNSYLTEESRLFLTQAEKETYVEGLRIAGNLLDVTGDNSYKARMFGIVQRTKAVNLLNEISAREAYIKAGVPDSVQQRQIRLANSISAYTMLLSGSYDNNPGRDTATFKIWKDELFSLNRRKEKLAEEIAAEYPDINNYLRRKDPVTLSTVQGNLEKNETVIDYLITGSDGPTPMELYIFLISGNELEIYETEPGGEFRKNAGIIRNSCQFPDFDNFRELADALAYMYEKLIKPLEKNISGDKLIIIPDAEISYLPFDAFIINDNPQLINNFSDAQFLVNKYTISYSFSSSLIKKKNTQVRRKTDVLSFVPFYEREAGNSGITVNDLKGALDETSSIYKWFRGKRYEGSLATLDEFRKVLMKSSVLHLAMHSFSDTADSRYSYLQFWSSDSAGNGGRLFNYEISLSDMNSPMVVLSSCSSGTGRMYSGEGMMSLARSFILAGAMSVVRTSWEVNDEISGQVIKMFYKRLSEGYSRDESLRLAKLDYLRHRSPNYAHPYYWAAYELTGDNSPLESKENKNGYVIPVLIISGGFLVFFYFSRRSTASASRL